MRFPGETLRSMLDRALRDERVEARVSRSATVTWFAGNADRSPR
jgi:hypothetical protein